MRTDSEESVSLGIIEIDTLIVLFRPGKLFSGGLFNARSQCFLLITGDHPFHPKLHAISKSCANRIKAEWFATSPQIGFRS